MLGFLKAALPASLSPQDGDGKIPLCVLVTGDRAKALKIPVTRALDECGFKVAQLQLEDHPSRWGKRRASFVAGWMGLGAGVATEAARIAAQPLQPQAWQSVGLALGDWQRRETDLQLKCKELQLRQDQSQKDRSVSTFKAMGGLGGGWRGFSFI